MFRSIVLFIALLAVAVAFTARGASRPARMTMLFSKKVGGTPAKGSGAFKVGEGSAPNEGSANKGTYVPEGITKAQYDAQLKKEAEAKAKKQAKFKIGKEPETLTEWMLKEKAKGNEGKGLLLKGHRMVKAKDPKWYTDESPV